MRKHGRDRDRNIDTDFIITATISEFQRISGIGRTQIDNLIAAGEIESINVGRRRLIVVASYPRFVARRQAAAAAAPRHQPPTPEVTRTGAR